MVSNLLFLGEAKKRPFLGADLPMAALRRAAEVNRVVGDPAARPYAELSGVDALTNQSGHADLAELRPEAGERRD